MKHRSIRGQGPRRERSRAGEHRASEGQPAEFWRRLSARAKAQLPWLVPLVLLAALREVHRVDAPPKVAPEQQAELAAIARAELGLAPPSAGGTHPSTAPGVTVNAPVFVSVYGRDAQGRKEPLVGTWQPDEGNPRIELSEAVRLAAREVARDLRAASRTPRDTTVRIDVAGPPRRLWRVPGLTNLFTNPGRDGWEGRYGDRRAFHLPCWSIERGQSDDENLVRLREELGGAPWLLRFRTTSWIALPHETRVHELFRGTALVTEITLERVAQALREAGRYLGRSIQSDGRYCYEYVAHEDRCTADYNHLRHAGTTYALYQIYQLFPEPELKDAAERATAWLRSQTRAVEGDSSRAFLLEGRAVKLGGAGLMLIALVERERALQDGRDRELMARLANFIISQQRSDGFFASYFDLGTRRPSLERNSIYYPGEALLGLIRLYSLDRQPRYLASSELAAEFLVKRRWRWGGIEVQVPPDAWLTQALAELDAIVPSNWLRDYAYEIVAAMDHMMLREGEGAEPDFVGGPANGFEAPNVTAAGSRSEALTAASRMAKRRGESTRIAWLQTASLRAARFQLSQQYRPENSYALPDPLRARGGIKNSPTDGNVRIDTVQHNATGLIGVLEILRGAKP